MMISYCSIAKSALFGWSVDLVLSRNCYYFQFMIVYEGLLLAHIAVDHNHKHFDNEFTEYSSHHSLTIVILEFWFALAHAFLWG